MKGHAMRRGRLLLEYAILVGLPSLGVLGVLRLGESLAAPPSIEGTWRLDARLDENEGTPCATHLAGFREPSFRILQSGVFVEIRLPNTPGDRLYGRFDEGFLVAEAKPALFGEDVFDLLRVSARLARENGRPLLRGVIAMPRRIDCAPVPYIASLEPARPDRDIRGIH